ncbi:nucleolar complex-associated protein-domain-containing protein [Panaeolus papilionaceus]|nr:nucleolar complex-associated protein-domain-containing protein [Panaeolus papilionaceus]
MTSHPKGKKRFAPSSQATSKKRKIDAGKPVQKRPQSNVPRKEKASERGIIPIPDFDNVDVDVELSDQDMQIDDELGSTAFLKDLNPKAIMRSKKETLRLHELTKPVRKQPVYNDDDLPSVNSDEESEDNWSSDLAEDQDSWDGFEGSLPEDDGDSDLLDSDVEMPYETAPRKRRPSWDGDEGKEVQGLPIKLADGQIKLIGTKVKRPATPSESEEESDHQSKRAQAKKQVQNPREDVSTGARFGRPAVVDILQTKSRKLKVEMAKGQIADICQEILADPENSLGLLKRLHSFSLPTVTTPLHPKPVPNDPIIRKLAMLSQLAVFKDIIPGYRIRELSEQEKSEKVSQMVQRTREWEQGLVTAYQSYLRLLEGELKAQSDLAEIALQSMCTLLKEVTHFNFRINLMTCIVGRLSKRVWDKTSDACSQTIVEVFREDTTGTPSLELVRLLNRMVKERQFKIHPNVLSCLLHLRLRTELGVRASTTRAEKIEEPERGKKSFKARKAEKIHLSKKAKKVYREHKEIEKEMKEAEAVVDREERSNIQTETLKLLFALYFRILKNPTPTPLLPSALAGISRFAHLVNIDFFKDLMAVLKDLIAMEDADADGGIFMSKKDSETDGRASDAADLQSSEASSSASLSVRIFQGATRRLMCIVTAFELLSGQGEALNLDLSDFVAKLYTSLLALSLSPEIDKQLDANLSKSVSNPVQSFATHQQPPLIDLLFRALNLAFAPQKSSSSLASTASLAALHQSPQRVAAFSKRLLTCALHWPSGPALRALDFVRALVVRDARLEVMLGGSDGEGRVTGGAAGVVGVYRPNVEDPAVSGALEGGSFYELQLLRSTHFDSRVRDTADKLLRYRSS